MASSSVDAEAGQPSQLPLQAQVGDPVLEPDELDAAAVRLHVRAHALERGLHPLGDRHRVEAVDQEQGGDDAVLREAVPRPRAPSSRAWTIRSSPSP